MIVQTTRVISVSPLKMRICLNGGAARQPCIIAPTIVRSPPDFPGFTEESLRETTCEGTPTHRLISFSPASDQNNRKGIKRPFSRVAQTPVDHMLIERRREGWGTDPRDFVRISGKPELIRVAGGNGTSPRQKCHVYGAKVNVRSQLSMNSRIMSDSIVGSR